MEARPPQSNTMSLVCRHYKMMFTITTISEYRQARRMKVPMDIVRLIRPITNRSNSKKHSDAIVEYNDHFFWFLNHQIMNI